MRPPRLLYYVLITTLTELILVSGAVLILLPTGFLKQLPLGVLGFLLVYKTVITAIVLVVMDRKQTQEHAVIVKGGGLLLGHVVGLLLGGILGGRYGGILWAIVGAISLYFLTGRIGAKISSALGSQLDRRFFPKEEAESISRVRPTGLLLIVYGAVVPALFVLIAIALNRYAVPTSEYSEVLSTARIVVILLSLFSIVLPWLLGSRRLKPATSAIARENAIFILGIGLSITPVVYGFFLFIVFGASIVELSIFAVVSSLTAILWSANTKIKQQNVG